MAYVQVLGFDVLLFLLSFFVYTRLGHLLKLTHRLLYGLEVVLAPGEEMISEVEKKLLSKPKRISRKRRKLQAHKEDDKAVEIKPNILQLTPEYPFLNLFPNFPELETLVSTSFFAFVIFLTSEICNLVLNTGRQEATSTFLLGIFVIAIVSLVSQTGASSSSEKSFCFVIGFFAMLISLFFIVGLHPSVLDFAFSAGMVDFRNSVYTLVQEMKLLDSNGDSVAVPGIQFFLWIFATALSLFAAILAAVLTLPAFQFARFHVECIGNSAASGSLEGNEESSGKATSTLRIASHHLNFFMPLIVVISWIPALSSDVVLKEGLTFCDSNAIVRDCLEANATGSMDDPYLLESQWYMVRFYILIFSILLRLFNFRPILSCFLDSGLAMAQYMGARGKDYSLETIKSVLDVTARFTCKVTIKMFAPIAMWGALTLLLQRWGGYSFGVVDSFLPLLAQSTGIALPEPSWSSVFRGEPSLLANSFPRMLAELVPNGDPEVLRQITLLNPVLLRAVISYVVWWSHLIWFLVSVLGYWYYSTQDSVAVIASGYKLQKKKKK